MIVFRADASAARGTAAVERCAALGAFLRARGQQCVLLCSPETTRLAPRSVALLDVIERSPERADWLVVDDPTWGAAEERAARGWALRVLVIDPYTTRPHDCDVLVDHALGLGLAAHRSLVPSACDVLTGPSHALLAPGLGALHEIALTRRSETQRLERVAVIGDPSLAPTGWKVDVIEPDALHLASRLVDADIAIARAGDRTWERCAAALPALVIGEGERDLEKRGAVRCVSDAGEALALLADDLDAWEGMARAAASLCDGLGAGRVAARLLP